MEQPMCVDKTIARNKSEFTMMMTLANGQQSRKQPAVELKSYDLTKKMVSIDDLSNLVATRINATQGQFADVIATGASMSLPNSYTGDASYIWDRVKSSWTKAVRVSPSHKKALVEAFKLDGDTINGLMQSIGQQAPDIIDEESERTSSKALNTRVTEKIADLICDHFNVERGAWPTDEKLPARSRESQGSRATIVKANLVDIKTLGPEWLPPIYPDELPMSDLILQPENGLLSGGTSLTLDGTTPHD